MRKKVKYLVVGGGISALSFARRAQGEDYLIVEKDSTLGGLCRTHYSGEYVWDYAGHFFHFSNPELKAFFDSKVSREEMVNCVKNTKIYYTGAGYKGTPYNNILIDSLPSTVFSGWMTVGNENYVYGFLDLDAGTHYLNGDKKFGALGYGFGDANSDTDDTSYAYPIGLNLDRINNTN